MTAAVLIIDMQKDFFLKDYKDQVYSKMVERTVVANTNRLLAAARPAGLPVIHSITRYKADRSDWTLRMKDINYEVCIEGTRGRTGAMRTARPGRAGPVFQLFNRATAGNRI